MSEDQKLRVERKEHVVEITISCVDEYRAMLLYDSLTHELSNGSASLSMDGVVKLIEADDERR